MEQIKFVDNIEALKLLYKGKGNGIAAAFEKDISYLESAFNEIEKLWLANLKEIDTIKYLMIAEAPLWGSEKKYIYNPETKNSQFFYRSDLNNILNLESEDVKNKDLITLCNELGLLVVDISPFALNSKDTKINYSKNDTCTGSIKLNDSEYQHLVESTIKTFFDLKIKEVARKKHENIQTFFRYKRVKSHFEKIVSKVLAVNKIIEHEFVIDHISQNGGGINKNKLSEIINKVP